MPSLFSHGEEYDEGYESELTGYNVLTFHYDEWWQELKHKLHHWWHEHLSRVSNEQLAFERKAERWALQAQEFDRRWAILQKPDDELTTSDILTLSMHNYEQQMIRAIRRQVFGTGFDNPTARGIWKVQTVPVQIEGLDGDVG